MTTNETLAFKQVRSLAHRLLLMAQP